MFIKNLNPNRLWFQKSDDVDDLEKRDLSGNEPIELKNVKLSHISFVTSGANKKKFAIIKSKDGKIENRESGEVKNHVDGDTGRYKSVIKLRKALSEFIDGSDSENIEPLEDLSESLAEYELALFEKVGTQKEDKTMDEEKTQEQFGLILKELKDQKSDIQELKKIKTQEKSDGQDINYLDSIEKEDEKSILEFCEFTETVDITDDLIEKEMSKPSEVDVVKDKNLSYKEYIRHLSKELKPLSKVAFKLYVQKMAEKGLFIERNDNNAPLYNESGFPKVAKKKKVEEEEKEKKEVTKDDPMDTFGPALNKMAASVTKNSETIATVAKDVDEMKKMFKDTGIVEKAGRIEKIREASNGVSDIEKKQTEVKKGATLWSGLGGSTR